MSKFLGIDTSCYTTSAAIYDGETGKVYEKRKILSVKPGKRGLSQSEMVYQHVRNIPEIFKNLNTYINDIKGIGVSAFPRRRADSFMPAFLVGKGCANVLGSTLHVPVYEFSHQENHTMAAICDFPNLWGKKLYVMHLSGGTNDVVRVDWEDNQMIISDVMHSLDITAGQYIDRIGVALGLQFPCGKELELLSAEGEHLYNPPIADVKNAFSFAGPETQVQKDILSKKFTKENIAQGVLKTIADALIKGLTRANLDKERGFIAIGGVMANIYLRERLMKFAEKYGISMYFAQSKYSTDNSTGNAFGAYMRYKSESLYCK